MQASILPIVNDALKIGVQQGTGEEAEIQLAGMLSMWKGARKYTDTNDEIVPAEMALALTLCATGHSVSAINVLLSSAACLEVSMLDVPPKAAPSQPQETRNLKFMQGMYGRPMLLVLVTQCVLAIIGGQVADQLRWFQSDRAAVAELGEKATTALKLAASALACWDALGAPQQEPLSEACHLAPSGTGVGVYGRVQLVDLARHLLDCCCGAWGPTATSAPPPQAQEDVLRAGLFVYDAFLPCVATSACEALVCTKVLEGMLTRLPCGRVRRHERWSDILDKTVSSDDGLRTVMLAASGRALAEFWGQGDT